MKQILIALVALLLLGSGCSEGDWGDTNDEHKKEFYNKVPWIYVNDEDSIVLSGIDKWGFYLEVYDITQSPAVLQKGRGLYRGRCYPLVRYKKGRAEYAFQIYNSTIGSAGSGDSLEVYGEISKERHIRYTLENGVMTLYDALSDYPELELQWIKDVYPWREKNFGQDFPKDGITYHVNVTSQDSTILIKSESYGNEYRWMYEKYERKIGKWELKYTQQANYCTGYNEFAPKTYAIINKYFDLWNKDLIPVGEVRYAIENNTLTLFDYAGLDKQELYQTTQTKKLVDTKIIDGTWSATFTKEIKTLVFEDSQMKEYLYNKDNPEQVLEYVNHGKYELESFLNFYEDRIFESYMTILLYKNKQRCVLNNNQLTVTTRSNGISTTTVYTKQK